MHSRLLRIFVVRGIRSVAGLFSRISNAWSWRNVGREFLRMIQCAVLMLDSFVLLTPAHHMLIR